MASSEQIAALVRQQGLHEQERGWSCGPAAVVNALGALGHRVSEDIVRELADTNSVDGTDEAGLLEALEQLGFQAETVWTSDTEGAWNRLVRHLVAGHPALLCVDEWDHWVTVVATDGGTVTVFDPAKEQEDTLDEDELVKRWQHPDEARPYYAILVSP